MASRMNASASWGAKRYVSSWLQAAVAVLDAA